MSIREDVAPDTLSIDLTPDGIAVEYLDGREVFYHGVPEKAEGSVRTAPGKEVHVLVTDASETQGVMMYVNDRKTRSDILEETGVGRVMIEDDDEATLFPGVRAHVESYRVVIEADFAAVDGRVFVFEEDEMGERSFELVPE